MRGFLNTIKGISRFLNAIAGISLTFLMLLTVTDVFLRSLVFLAKWLIKIGMQHQVQILIALADFILKYFRPVVGTYELVAFSGAVVIGFALPLSSLLRTHIFVDFFILKFSKRSRNIFNIATRSLGIILFFLIGWNLLKYGMDLQKSGEVSLTLQMPFYPVAYGVGICCFIQCLVLVYDIVKVFEGTYDE